MRSGLRGLGGFFGRLWGVLGRFGIPNQLLQLFEEAAGVVDPLLGCILVTDQIAQLPCEAVGILRLFLRFKLQALQIQRKLLGVLRLLFLRLADELLQLLGKALGLIILFLVLGHVNGKLRQIQIRDLPGILGVQDLLREILPLFFKIFAKEFHICLLLSFE